MFLPTSLRVTSASIPRILRNTKEEKEKKPTKVKHKSRLLESDDQKVIIRKAKPFSERGAYVYLHALWLGKKGAIQPYRSRGSSNTTLGMIVLHLCPFMCAIASFRLFQHPLLALTVTRLTSLRRN